MIGPVSQIYYVYWNLFCPLSDSDQEFRKCEPQFGPQRMTFLGSPIRPSWWAFLFNKKTCLLVEQEDMSSCWTRRHVYLPNKKTCLLVGQEHMSSCRTRRHVFLCSKHPGGTQEAPRKHPGGTQEAPFFDSRAH